MINNEINMQKEIFKYYLDLTVLFLNMYDLLCLQKDKRWEYSKKVSRIKKRIDE